MDNKYKNIIIIVMAIIILLLSTYLIYNNLNKNENLKVQEQDFDLVEAKELVDKYYYFQWGSNFFETGFTEEIKMVIAFKKISNEYKIEQDCNYVYESDNNAMYESYYYRINLNTFGEKTSSFCDEKTKKIEYSHVNNVYKSLFGKDMPKEDLAYLLYYDFKDNNFYELNCHCGGIGPDDSTYSIKHAKVIDDKLIIDVEYKKVQTLDDVEIFKLTFKKENNNYILIDMIKKLYS